MTCRELGKKIGQLIASKDVNRTRNVIQIDNISEVHDSGFRPHTHPFDTIKYVNGHIEAKLGKTSDIRRAMTIKDFCDLMNNLANKHRFYFDKTDFIIPGCEITNVFLHPITHNITIEVNNVDVDESVGSALKIGLLASFLGIPGILPAQSLSKNIDNAKAKTQQSSPSEKQKMFDKAIEDSLLVSKTYDGYRADLACNALALTLFGEGRGDGEEALRAITCVILNRAEQKLDNIPSVIFARKQFSYWNKRQDQIQKLKSQALIPTEAVDNAIERKAWELCKSIASEVFLGKFKNNMKDINSYYVTNMKDPPKWTKMLSNEKKIKHHTFGYLASNDPVVIAKANHKTPSTSSTYVIKKGDTLAKIASNYNTTVDDIVKKNKISNPNKISIGQKITV